MPFLFSKDGVQYNPVEFITTQGGVSKNISQINTTKDGVNHIVWQKGSPVSKVLYLMSEIPTSPTRFEFAIPWKYRITCIGNGGNGGAGGNKWGAYDGGQGGGGGTGGIFVMDADFTNGVTAYLEFARDYYYIPTPNSIFCRFVDYNAAIQHPVFVTYSGLNGNGGSSAGAFTPQPSGGQGGAPGRTDYKPYLNSDAAWEFTTTTYGGWGNTGGSGYNHVDPGERRGEGNAGEPPLDGYVYDGLCVGTPIWDGSTLHQNPYQRPSGWSIATTWTHQEPITGYTVDNICLGNAGAGGWRTINYGNINPGTGAQGGIVIELLI